MGAGGQGDYRACGVDMQVNVNRCKCGKFARREDCPKCRAAHAREDKWVRFLIGDVVRVRPQMDLASARLQAARAAGCYEG